MFADALSAHGTWHTAHIPRISAEIFGLNSKSRLLLGSFLQLFSDPGNPWTK